MRSYSRFFVQLINIITLFMARGLETRGPAAERKLMRIYSVMGPFYRIAYQLDMLLFFTRGYALVAVAKRRAWCPRNAPILNDGRSISEAVLSKALR